MHNRYNFILQPFFMIVDITIMIAVHNFTDHIWSPGSSVYHIHPLLIALAWFGISLSLQIYTDRRNRGLRWLLQRVNSGMAILSLIIFTVIIFGKYDVSRAVILLFVFLSIILINGSTFIRWLVLRSIRARGYNSRFLAFIGFKGEIESLLEWIGENPEFGYRNTRTVEVDPDYDVQGLLRKIHDLAASSAMDELAIGRFHHGFPRLNRIIDIGEEYGLRVRLVQDIPTLLQSRSPMDLFGPFAVVNIRQEPLNSIGARLSKRIVDIAFSLVILITVYWWVYLIAGLSIKLTSPGPIVFRQMRVGRDGKHFVCYKFRTMKPNGSDMAGNGEITKEDDDRVTWIGKLLRKSNLDELPQFYNVLRGDMSIIGPRPHMVEEDEAVSELLTKYKLRRFVKPGITGLAAVKGYRGGTANMDLMQERVNHDIYYIENWSMWMDIKIFFLTIWQMLTFTTKAY